MISKKILTLLSSLAIVSAYADNATQDFLDQGQYTENGILRYEKIFGEGFISTGGFETTQEFVDSLTLKSGHKVLDVGCGIGGSAAYMSNEYGAEVLGVDLSTNMIDIAIERYGDMPGVDFQVVDIMDVDYPENSFDVIYSRDTILHIAEKKELFKKFNKWLTPGGKLMISDYCRGDQEHSKEFTSYVADRDYQLVTLNEYGSLIEKAGFSNVGVSDRSSQFRNVLERELVGLRTMESSDDSIDLEDSEYLIQGWEQKIIRSEAGDHKWGLFTAEKNLKI